MVSPPFFAQSLPRGILPKVSPSSLTVQLFSSRSENSDPIVPASYYMIHSNYRQRRYAEVYSTVITWQITLNDESLVFGSVLILVNSP